MQKSGGWVFLSHSHLDIDLVRKIRNELEKRGFEPLVFFLKCLNDEDEIVSLIQREIDERDWFIFIESPNSLKSKWVKSEREYISQKDGKKVFTINTNRPILIQIEDILRQQKVFITYSHSHRDIYKMIKNALIERDFLVFDEYDLELNPNSINQIKNEIEDSSRNGFVLLLVTEQLNKSTYLKDEIELALKAKGKIIPVYIGNATLDPTWPDDLRERMGVHLDEKPTEDQIKKLISFIEHQIQYYDSDFTTSIGFRGAKTIRYPEVASIPDYTFYDCDNLEKVYIPSNVSYISDKAFRKDQNVVIVCEKGSFAHEYCLKNNINFELKELSSEST